MLNPAERDAYLHECRSSAIGYLEGLIGERERANPAYRAVLDYPLREAKGLRPAISIAMCRALGGSFADILPTASVFELLHNAFLVHDDVEDGSEMRRHAPTLAVQLGVPLAVHTGDTMLSMAFGPLLDNMRLLDLGRALRILDLVAAVMRRTVEGQALELTWISEQRWDITPDEYVEMVTLKTAWYTFVGPMVAGAITAEASSELIAELSAFAIDLGVAFQIRDDTLNLLAESDATGKESWGDLWEGKRTLILSLFFAGAPEADLTFAREVLRKRRPTAAVDGMVDSQIDQSLSLVGDLLTADQQQALRAAIRGTRLATLKNDAEIARLRSLVDPYIASATQVASDFASRARARWASLCRGMERSIHRDLIESILAFTVVRGR